MARWYRDHYEWVLTLIWEELLEVDPISVRDNFFDLGGTEKSYEVMVEEVQRRFGVSLEDDSTSTIETLALDVRTRRNSSGLKQKPFFIPGSGAGSIPLVYIHGVAGECMFDPRLLRFDMGRPIVSIRSIGMDLEEAPLTTVEAMVERYVADLTEISVGEPYVIAGSSASAVIAFAMAQWLEEQGKTVAYAGLLEPPLLGDEEPPEFQVAVQHRMRELCLGGEVDFRPGQMEMNVQALKNAGDIPRSYPTDLVLRHAEVFGYNVRAANLYRPTDRFSGHAVLYESREFGRGREPIGSLDAPPVTMPQYEQFWVKYLPPRTLVRRQNCEHRSIDRTKLIRTWLRDDINEALRHI
ncbi:thioesterase domain-containing protein [Streptomyces sp. NPDC005953]|uniref:thioesterase domain-containing protein n=1 Tax=Streptomyces sp. NPDC005953 TaxID=3156719 RepID=UPI0033FA242D